MIADSIGVTLRKSREEQPASAGTCPDENAEAMRRPVGENRNRNGRALDDFLAVARYF
ncbi:MAG: hypothetical protein LBO79_05765 [Zoogloeaceae bacterium]|nr:hypothetical protein [Zoogloeaceae bacterium]